MRKIETLLFALCKRIVCLVRGRDVSAHEREIEVLFQFAKFGIVGVSNTLLSYLLNIAVLRLLEPFGLAWDYMAGNAVAFVLSVLWSFYWNKRFVFEKRKMTVRETLKRLGKTYLAYAFTGIILNTLLSWIWIEIIGISKYIAPLINLIISVPVNFVINKLWAFS